MLDFLFTVEASVSISLQKQLNVKRSNEPQTGSQRNNTLFLSEAENVHQSVSHDYQICVSCIREARLLTSTSWISA